MILENCIYGIREKWQVYTDSDPSFNPVESHSIASEKIKKQAQGQRYFFNFQKNTKVKWGKS